MAVSAKARSALWYARTLQWDVFPLHYMREDGTCSCNRDCGKSAGKHPMTAKGFLDASSDPEVVEEMWRRRPDANIGLATGSRSGLVVLDIDPRNGGDDGFDDLIDIIGKLPDTVESLTGGGGRHILFTHPGEDVRIRSRQDIICQGRTLRGLDIKADGGYIVVPPSNHKSGGTYEWEASSTPQATPIVPLPPRLYKILKTDQLADKELPTLPEDDGTIVPSRATTDRLEGLCEELRNAARGTLHGARKHCGKVAGRLVGGGLVGSMTALDLLTDAAEESSSKGRAFVRQQIAEHMKYGVMNPWTEMPPGVDRPPPPSDDDAPPWAFSRPRRDDRPKKTPEPRAEPAPEAPPEPEPTTDTPKQQKAAGDDVEPERSKEEPRPKEKPCIYTTWHMDEMIEASWLAIHQANDPPRLFRRGRRFVRVVQGDYGLEMEYVNPTIAYGVISRVALWTRDTKKGDVNARPVKEVSHDMIENTDPKLPVLDAIVGSPCLDDIGRLVTEEGYHPDSRLWLHMGGQLDIPPIPENPTSGEVASSLTILIDELLDGFPFADSSDRANAIGLLLLPFVRRMVRGSTPIHMIEAPTPGTGKSLLAETIGAITIGRDPPSTTVSSNGDETRKKITAMLTRAQPMVIVDNMAGKVDTSELASAITASVWSDRIMGVGKMIDLPNRAVWVATANNPKLSLELARRCVRIRIEADSENPWEQGKKVYKHQLPHWAYEVRGQLIHACLTMVRAWQAEGCPQGKQTMGSFEDWAGIIGGILEVCGVSQFLGNQAAMYEHAMGGGVKWHPLIHMWWERYRDRDVEVKQLVRMCSENEFILEVIGDKSDQSKSIRLGKALTAIRGRVFAGRQVVTDKDSSSKRRVYKLKDLGGSS